MKNSKLIPVSLVFVFVLTACQLFSSGSAPATEVPATEVPAVTTAAAGAYPYPENGALTSPAAASNAYPGSEVQLTPLAIGAYPETGATVPPAAAQMAYPSPVVQPLTAQTEPVYPDLKDGAEVTWSQVKDIIFSGQVVRVGQTHDLNVYITLKDGRTFKTVEPAIDDVIKLIKACGDLCKDIKVATQ
jgi:hypothetical protein